MPPMATRNILAREPTAFCLEDSEICSACSHQKTNCKWTILEGSLEVKFPTICRDGKAEVGRVRTEKSRSVKIRDGESQKREDAGVRKGRKVAIYYVFLMIWGSGESKSNLAKAAGAEAAGHSRTTFGS